MKTKKEEVVLGKMEREEDEGGERERGKKKRNKAKRIIIWNVKRRKRGLADGKKFKKKSIK